MPIDRMTDSANIRMADVTFENLLDVRRIQRCTRDNPMGEAMLIGDALQPFVSPTGFRRIPADLDVHAFDHILVAGIRQIVFQQVILSNRSEVSFQPRRQEMLLQPRVFVAAEIPKMMVRVDHRMRRVDRLSHCITGVSE